MALNKKKLLIAGDSFSADWSVKYSDNLGWVNLFHNFEVKNISQAGASEYKIYKQILYEDLSLYDKIIICHTSPFRIYAKQHPIHAHDILHKNCDLIYNDLLSHKDNVKSKIALDFFETYFDQEYAEFTHNLITEKIIEMSPFAHHITFFESSNKKLISFYKLYVKHKGLINHLSKLGNEIVYKEINLLL